MGSVSADALFGGLVVIFVGAIGLIIKVAVDFGQIKAGLKAAHQRLDKLNGLAVIKNSNHDDDDI